MPKHREKAFDQLVLPPGHKDMVKSLITQHFRDKESGGMEHTDIVRGKGTSHLKSDISYRAGEWWLCIANHGIHRAIHYRQGSHHSFARRPWSWQDLDCRYDASQPPGSDT